MPPFTTSLLAVLAYVATIVLLEFAPPYLCGLEGRVRPRGVGSLSEWAAREAALGQILDFILHRQGVPRSCTGTLTLDPHALCA